MKALLALTLAAAAAVPAQANTLLSMTPGNAVYSGPGFNPSAFFDFDSPTPRWDGSIVTGSSSGVHVQPLGSTGGYASVGPTDGTPGTFNFVGFGPLRRVSFIWGTVEQFNKLEVLGAGGTVIKTFMGNPGLSLPQNPQTSPSANPLVTLTFVGETYGQVTGLRFSSSQNAFEFDNLAVAVPEPATWAMMIGGFGLVGFAARRRSMAKVITA